MEVVNEKDVINNPFVNLTKDEIDETNADTMTTCLSNNELLKYDYTEKHIGSRTFMGKSLKKKIKMESFKDEMCIKKTLKEFKICIKNNIAVKLAKVNFRDDYATMNQYNKILEPHGCWFYFLGKGLGKITRLTEFIGDVLVVRKVSGNSTFHKVPLSKRKIEEETFDDDVILKNSEGEFFYYFQYELCKIELKKNKRGRQLGLTNINNL